MILIIFVNLTIYLIKERSTKFYFYTKKLIEG